MGSLRRWSKTNRPFQKFILFSNRCLKSNIVVHHSPFDRVAFKKAFDRYGLEPFEVQWLDSVRVARNTWDGIDGGYNLANLAYHLDIEFQHHDALEDAITAGKIVVEACKRHTCEITGWFDAD